MSGKMVVGALCLWVCACGKSGDKSTDKAEGAPAGGAAAEISVDAQAAVAPAAATDATGAKIAKIAPMHFEPVVFSHEFDFLGWTQDGLSFALQQRYFDDIDGNLANGDELLFELRQVYDSLTGALVHSFRVRRNKAKLEAFAPGLAAWKRAKPKAEWKAFATANKVVRSKPSSQAPGPWKLSIAKVGGKLGKHVELKLKTRKNGFSYVGDFIAAKRDPRVEVMATSKGQRHVVFRHGWQVKDGVGLRGFVRGNFRPYWSPAGDRVVWAVFRNTSPDKISSIAQRAHFVLGALGPQILILDRGMGLDGARQTAAQLGRASLPVARVFPRSAKKADAALVGSRVLYVGSAAKPTADAVARVLGLSAEAAPKNHAHAAEAEVIVELAGTVAPVASLFEGGLDLSQLGWSAAASGRNIGRLCAWFVETRASLAAGHKEVDEADLDPAELLACSKRLRSLKPTQRDEMADCANSCGDMDGIPLCYEDYGTPVFPACGGEDDEGVIDVD